MGKGIPAAVWFETLFDGHSIVVCPESIAPDAIRAALYEVYFGIASQLVQENIEKYAPLFDGTVSGVIIKEFKSQWGSCTAKNKLSFNLKLVLYDKRVLEYVVIHELAHMRHRDHSAAFWAAVASAMPDYKKQREQLKTPLAF